MDEAITTLYTGEMIGNEVILKRLFDVFLSLALTAALSPLLLLTALLIRLTSPGPVFFVQERVGLNKRRFGVYKFRTMCVDAEKRMAELEHLNEVKGAAFKIRNDPRITPVGRFLRKTSIDELPQLFNVLLGDMSLVGPRPLPIRDYKGFDQDWHRRRFSVRPGITCLLADQRQEQYLIRPLDGAGYGVYRQLVSVAGHEDFAGDHSGGSEGERGGLETVQR